MRAATRVNAAQASKRTMCRPTRLQFRGRLIRLGEMSEDDAQFAAPGYWRRHVHKESARNTGSPMAWLVRDDQPDAREGEAGRCGVAERFVVCAGQRVSQGG